VHNPYDGRWVSDVSVPTPDQVEAAVQQAHDAVPAARSTSAHRRAEALSHVADQLERRLEETARTISAETGKPIQWARVEVGRSIAVFRLAAEECTRFSGALSRLDGEPSGAGRLALIRRFPRGPVLGISPFNFPLNLAAHKVAPAIAVGAPIILKPAPKAPLSGLLLGELLAETDLPAGMTSVLTVPDSRAPELAADPRLPVVSFTGSGPVGFRIRESLPHKHVTLELGGNAAVLVCADYSSDDDLRYAASRIAAFATYQAGQSCISVQRVLAESSVHDRLLEMILEETASLTVGDPADDKTHVGPVIDIASAQRLERWIDAAVEQGASLLHGGHRDGTTIAPTVLAGVPDSAEVWSEEAFGPVLCVREVSSIDEGFAVINDSRFGLQAGVFTKDLATAMRAHQELAVGGVVVGDVPSYRSDRLPYGGAKDSGVGREGVVAAMEDYTEVRTLVLSGIPV
jgi:acyl-CoA reductase-like NAD-dependent aldehyde dehydrogenase